MRKIKALSVSLFICAVLCVFFAVNASAANYPNSISGTMSDTSSPDNGTVKWLFEYDERTYSARLTLSGDGYMPNYTNDSWYTAQEETGCWIKELVIEEGVRSIMDSAFDGEAYLTSVTLPESIENIGEYAFYGTAVTSINIPSKVKNVNGTMFPSDYICNFYVSEKNPYLTSVDGVVYSKDMSVLQVFPVGRYTADKSYTFDIPESVTEIADYAFMNSDAVSVTIPGNVKTIKSQAFIGNVYLTDLTLENGIEYIYDSAFLSCTALKEVTIPKSVKYIGYMAFGYVAAIDFEGVEQMLDGFGISHPQITANNVEFYVGFYTPYSVSDFVYWEYNEDFVIYASDNTAGASYILRISKPVLKTADEVYGGIKFSWEPLKYADGYYIYRKTGENGPWQIIGKVDGQNTVSFLDETASPKVTYYYSVSAFDSLGAMSDFDDNGVSAIYYLKAPAVNSLSNVAGGVNIKWNKVSGATYYYVYRKASTESKYSYIGYTSSTSYTDTNVTNEVLYTYTVLAANTDETSTFNPDGWSIKYIATPTLVSAANVGDGVTVTWKAVLGADSYRVYRKTSSSGWTCLNDKVTSTSYTDKTAKSGTTYYYTVRAENEAGVSGYNSTGVSVKYLATPTLSTPESAYNGIVLKWSAVAGAEKYIITYGTAYNSINKIIAEVGGSVTTYTHKGALSGVSNFYTVTAVCGDSKTISNYEEIYFLMAPTASVSNVSGGINISWSAVDGAESYNVYRKVSGGSEFSYLGTTASTSYTDSTVKNGVTYVYTVSTYDGDEESYNPDGWSIKYITTPTLSSATNVGGGVTVTWKAVSGADSYRVYRKTASDTSWTCLNKKVTGTSYKDTTAKSGTTYYYTVKAENKAGVSGYNKTGVSVKYLAMPTVTVANASTGVKVSWNKITGASKYYVYRKASSEKDWTWLTSSATGTSYTDTKAKSGTTYYYTVRAVSGSVASAFKSSSALKYLAQPSVTVSNANSGITVKWNKITGASGYYVYRKTGSGSWSLIYTVKSGSTVSYTDKSAKAGTTYYYTVRAYSGSVKSTFTSSTAIRRLTTPTLKSVSSATSGITFKWNKVTGASGYYVYRKTGSGSWQKIATVKSGSTVSYLDKTAKKGTTYTYTVRAYYSSSSVSYFNTTGLKIKDKY